MSMGAIVVACGLLCRSLVGGSTDQEYRHRHSVDASKLDWSAGEVPSLQQFV